MPHDFHVLLSNEDAKELRDLSSQTIKEDKPFLPRPQNTCDVCGDHVGDDNGQRTATSVICFVCLGKSKRR